MYAQVEKPKENKSRAVANSIAQKKNNGKQGFGFVDNRHIRNEVSQAKSEKVIQCISIEDSVKNVAAYSPQTYNHYGAELIRKVLTDNNLTVRGHASGGGGNAQNQATTDDIAKLIPFLRTAFAALPKSTKQEQKTKPDKSKRNDEATQKALDAKKIQDKKDKAAKKKKANGY